MGDRLESDRSFEVAIRYVNEHATATKSRVRKKHDEINSLRDGVRSYHDLLIRGVANTHFTAFQCHISSGVYQGYGVEPGDLRLHRCYGTLHTSELLSGT